MTGSATPPGDEYARRVECSECGAANGTDAIADGETFRATTCTDCGEWFTVYVR